MKTLLLFIPVLLLAISCTTSSKNIAVKRLDDVDWLDRFKEKRDVVFIDTTINKYQGTWLCVSGDTTYELALHKTMFNTGTDEKLRIVEFLHGQLITRIKGMAKENYPVPLDFSGAADKRNHTFVFTVRKSYDPVDPTDPNRCIMGCQVNADYRVLLAAQQLTIQWIKKNVEGYFYPGLPAYFPQALTFHQLHYTAPPLSKPKNLEGLPPVHL